MLRIVRKLYAFKSFPDYYVSDNQLGKIIVDGNYCIVICLSHPVLAFS